MVYKENFVVAIKSNGKILREINNIVTLPFGSEYSILLKNLNSVSAVVKIDVDGERVTKGGDIIVKPNSSTELTGILKGSTVKNRFKFIQKTKEISDYRGDRVDDGIIRVEYQFEKKQLEPYTYWYYQYPVRRYGDNINCYSNLSDEPVAMFASGGTSTTSSSQNSTSFEPSDNQDGITVEGSDTEQNFQFGWVDELETNSYVINIVLKGTDSRDKEVEKPIFVRTKYTCKTCGKVSESSAKFCNRCGTRLL